MGFTAMSVFVVESSTGGRLTDDSVKKLAKAGEVDPGEGSFEIERISADAPELGLWLDWHLAKNAMMNMLTRGSAPTVVLVEDGLGSNGAGQVVAALHHLRTHEWKWLQVRYLEPGGSWRSMG